MTERNPYDVVISRLKRKKGESTFQEYQRHLRDYKEWLAEKKEMTTFDAKPLDIEDMVDDMLDSGYSASSINVRYAALGEYYKEAERLARDRINPNVENPLIKAPSLTQWQNIKQEQKEKKHTSKEDVPYLSPEDARKLVQNVPQPTIRNECMIRLALATGLRRGELVRLKLTDGTWTRENEHETFATGPAREIRVRAEIAKSGEKRVVGWPSDNQLEFLLKQWIEDYRPTVAMAAESDYLFPSNRSRHISGQAFNDVVKEAAKNADIQEPQMVNKAGEERNAVTSHVLRHTFAMRCINSGWDIYALSSALGHSSVEVTENTYLHDAEEVVLSHFREKGPKYNSD